MKGPFRKEPAEEERDPRSEMRDAIASVLEESGVHDAATSVLFYDQLSDEELIAYIATIWNYLSDLRDEWSRREMMKAVT